MSFDRKLSVILFVFSAWTLYVSLTTPTSAIPQRIGPEVMPAIVSVGLMLSAVALYVRSMRLEAVAHASGTSGEAVEQEDRVTQVLVVLGLIAYIALFERLGFVVATALFCIYEASVLEAKYWVRNVTAGVVFSVAVYTLFVRVLEVMLPVGVLGW